ncbi:MAG: ribonuclease III [Proteobacteria bacterium]|nr:ribonuclease III [Pseudomonadota bacterium]
MNNIEVLDLVQDAFPVQLRMMEQLCRRVRYGFRQRSLLLESMTHSSAARYVQKKYPNADPMPWNERLEFLGDSVLSLVLSSALLKRPECFPEGQLSKIRASLVNENTLARISRDLQVGQCLLLAPGEERAGGREKDSVLADALEAFFGAIYLDSDFEATSVIVLNLYKDILTSSLTELTQQDYKSRLQELTQGAFKEAPVYKVIKREGPDHQLDFAVEVVFRGKSLGMGHGPSKKSASQEAARAALNTWTDLKKMGYEGLSWSKDSASI